MSNKQNDIWEENKRELKCMYCGGEGAMCQKCKEKYVPIPKQEIFDAIGYDKKNDLF